MKVYSKEVQLSGKGIDVICALSCTHRCRRDKQCRLALLLGAVLVFAVEKCLAPPAFAMGEVIAFLGLFRRRG